MSSAWTLIAIAILPILIAIVKKRKSKNLPPSPRGLPIIGHFHLLGKNPHQDLHKLARKHGDLMYLKLGSIDTFVVSSPLGAEQILKTHDLTFAGRPTVEVLKYLGYGQRLISFSSYGPYWRAMRKMCILEMLSNKRIQSFQPMRRNEVGLFIDSLKHAAVDGATVDLSAAVSSLSTNMSCLMIFGKKYGNNDFDNRGFKDVTQEASGLVGSPNVGDFFPFLRRFDIQGIRQRSMPLARTFDEFFEKIINEHEETWKEGQKNDLVSTLLAFVKSEEADFPFDLRHVKAVMVDLLFASMDTTASLIEWGLSELLKHPEIMKKVQKELEEKVGMNRTVEESDLANLDYLEIVVKEIFRLHPSVPLLPHEALEDCVVDGFHIPKKSRVLVNVWAIGRDPDVWSNPELFIPDRFLGSNIDARGQHFELIPFGSGRRSCPGMQLALTVVKLLIAQLMHCFYWKLPRNMLPSKLDMTEEFGLVVSRAIHLMAIPTYRLQK